MREKTWSADSKELTCKIRLLNPKRHDAETLTFSVAWVVMSKIITKSVGWRLREGKILAPSVRTKSGWTPTHTTTEEFIYELCSLLTSWKTSPEFKGIAFPEVSLVPTTLRKMTEKDYRKPGVQDLGDGDDLELVSSDGLCCRCRWVGGVWRYSIDEVGCDCHYNPNEPEAKGIQEASKEVK